MTTSSSEDKQIVNEGERSRVRAIQTIERGLSLNTAPGSNFYNGLVGHKVIIIGGTRGIGLGVANAFLSTGANIHIIGRSLTNVTNAINLLKSEYSDPNLTINGSSSDVKDEVAITTTLREIVDSDGQFDHVVYTAVDERIRGSIDQQDLDDAKDLFGVKFWGQVIVANAIAKYDLVKPGGSYTITSGSLSLRPKVGTAVGASLNASVNTLAKGLALDLAPKKVRVNAVIPGFVTSPHEISTPELRAVLAKRGEKLLTGFIGTTRDIAVSYLYFAKAKYITGDLVLVDGGDVLSGSS